MNKFSKAGSKLLQALGREPTAEEMALELDTPHEKVLQIIRKFRRSVSMEAPVGDDEATLAEFIENLPSPSPLAAVSRRLLQERLAEVLSALPARERRIIELRFGLRDGRCYTLETIAVEFSLTKERIRQLEAEAMRQLRRPIMSRKLVDFLD